MRSLEEAISELERELQVRMRCYDRWVKDGKLSSVDAKDRAERLSAAIQYLKGIQAEESEPHAIATPTPNLPPQTPTSTPPSE